MCGIAGIIQKNVGELDLGFASCLRHRGPDDYGWLCYGLNGIQTGYDSTECPSGLALLVHYRLSILDLSEAGRQPMGTADNRYFIIFNGEIYNYLELRSQLEDAGYRFYSNSDTEVLIQAYVHWGTSAFNRLVGMFAFALLDTTKKELVLVRDFFGIKPLYYSILLGRFVFASEIKALLNLPGLDRQLNPQRLYSYLRFNILDHGSETLFKSVSQIPPGHYAVIKLDRPQDVNLIRFWRLESDNRSDISFSEATEKVRDLFLESVKLHLRSDVPVGTALSGGIDSSSIVMAVRHLEPSLEIKTFSFIPDDPNLSEEKWVDTVEQAGMTEAYKVQPEAKDLIQDLRSLVYFQDQPFGSTSIYAQYRVMRLAKEAGIKVLLDGQGADEVFAGYDHLLAARLASLIRQKRWREALQFSRQVCRNRKYNWQWFLMQTAELFLPPKLESAARDFLGFELAPDWLELDWFTEQDAGPEPVRKTNSPNVLRYRLQQLMFENCLPNLLRYEDRNSMAFSIESRVPFLVPELVSFVYSLPEEYLISPQGDTKYVLREAMRGIVPEVILNRKDKMGFAAPEKQWFTILWTWVQKVLSGETANQLPMLNISKIKKEFIKVTSGRQSFHPSLWRCVNFIIWAEQFNIL